MNGFHIGDIVTFNKDVFDDLGRLYNMGSVYEVIDTYGYYVKLASEFNGWISCDEIELLNKMLT